MIYSTTITNIRFDRFYNFGCWDLSLCNVLPACGKSRCVDKKAVFRIEEEEIHVALPPLNFLWHRLRAIVRTHPRGIKKHTYYPIDEWTEVRGYWWCVTLQKGEGVLTRRAVTAVSGAVNKMAVFTRFVFRLRTHARASAIHSATAYTITHGASCMRGPPETTRPCETIRCESVPLLSSIITRIISKYRIPWTMLLFVIKKKGDEVREFSHAVNKIKIKKCSNMQ